MIKPFIAKYGERREGEPKRLDKALLVKREQGGFNLLRDLHDLWLLVNESMMSLNVLEQAARALRDEKLLDTLNHIQQRNERQQTWLKTKISQASSLGLGGDHLDPYGLASASRCKRTGRQRYPARWHAGHGSRAKTDHARYRGRRPMAKADGAVSTRVLRLLRRTRPRESETVGKKGNQAILAAAQREGLIVHPSPPSRPHLRRLYRQPHDRDPQEDRRIVAHLDHRFQWRSRFIRVERKGPPVGPTALHQVYRSLGGEWGRLETGTGHTLHFRTATHR